LDCVSEGIDEESDDSRNGRTEVREEPLPGAEASLEDETALDEGADTAKVVVVVVGTTLVTGGTGRRNGDGLAVEMISFVDVAGSEEVDVEIGRCIDTGSHATCLPFSFVSFSFAPPGIDTAPTFPSMRFSPSTTTKDDVDRTRAEDDAPDAGRSGWTSSLD
jgi:hypothetical protein